jgi:hypothetical protein
MSPAGVTSLASKCTTQRTSKRRAWYGPAPHGDDPADQMQIMLGIEYFKEYSQ